jgi:hypothetical protein
MPEFKYTYKSSDQGKEISDVIFASDAEELSSMLIRLGIDPIKIEEVVSTQPRDVMKPGIVEGPGNAPAPARSPSMEQYRYFSTDGIDFRMDVASGTMERRSWVEIDHDSSDAEEYAIISPSGAKRTILSQSKIRLAKLSWISVE